MDFNKLNGKTVVWTGTFTDVEDADVKHSYVLFDDGTAIVVTTADGESAMSQLDDARQTLVDVFNENFEAAKATMALGQELRTQKFLEYIDDAATDEQECSDDEFAGFDTTVLRYRDLFQTKDGVSVSESGKINEYFIHMAEEAVEPAVTVVSGAVIIKSSLPEVVEEQLNLSMEATDGPTTTNT
jgi:hypothetical protein